MKSATLLVGGTQGYMLTDASFTRTEPNKGHLIVACLHGMGRSNEFCRL